jgi:CheY-like chemotaxis protein
VDTSIRLTNIELAPRADHRPNVHSQSKSDEKETIIMNRKFHFIAAWNFSFGSHYLAPRSASCWVLSGHSSFFAESRRKDEYKNTQEPGSKKRTAIRNYGPGARSSAAKIIVVKSRATLLLTTDSSLEEIVADVMLDADWSIHLARNLGDALDLLCRVHDLDLAMVDFGPGPHGITLLRAIRTLHRDVPAIVITDDDQKHVEALAYTNGAAAGLHKPVLRSHLADAVHSISKPTRELAFA